MSNYGNHPLWEIAVRKREDIMTSKAVVWIAVIATIAVLGVQNVSAVDKNSRAPTGIPPRTVADHLHAVIMAQRHFYTIHVVNRLPQEGIVDVSENWRATNSLPLPVKFLQETSEMAELTGTNVRYHLISTWPINKRNAAATEFEESGLAEVITQSSRLHVGFVETGGNRYFQAVYADRAVN